MNLKKRIPDVKSLPRDMTSYFLSTNVMYPEYYPQQHLQHLQHFIFGINEDKTQNFQKASCTTSFTSVMTLYRHKLYSII